MPRPVRTLLKITFVLSCLGVLAYWFYATIVFSIVLSHAPLAPDAAQGFVAPYDSHGTIHYFRPADLAMHSWAKMFAFVCHGLLIGSAIIGLIFSKPRASAE